MKKIIFIIVILFSLKTLAQDVTQGYCGTKDDNGNYGTNCEWNYDSESKTLKIWGHGSTYSTIYADFPWRQSYFNEIENVVIENGITNIGMHAFIGAQNITNVSLPASLSIINYNAFRNMESLTSLAIPDSVTMIYGSKDSYPFGQSLQNLYCSEAQQDICRQALEWSNLNAQEVLKTYQKYGDAYYIDGKFYKSPNDIGTPNYIKKRVYTIDEANRVAGDKNRVSIKYR